jgi:hypothetical protein
VRKRPHGNAALIPEREKSKAEGSVPARRVPSRGPRGEGVSRYYRAGDPGQSRSLLGLMPSRPGEKVDKKFLWKDGTPGAVGHWCWWNELDDPLSSFVPETLSPAPGGVFLSLERSDRERTRSLLSGEAVPHQDTGADRGPRQAVWPGSSADGVCNLLSSVIVAAPRRPF